MTNTDLIQSSEAATILSLSQRTFNRRVESGAIVPAATLSGPTGPRLFDRKVIEQLAAKQVAA